MSSLYNPEITILVTGTSFLRCDLQNLRAFSPLRLSAVRQNAEARS